VTEGKERGSTYRVEAAEKRSGSHARAAAQTKRNLPLTAAARTLEVAGDRIDTPPFSAGKEAADAWVGKEVVFIVG
jgi:hypothetical protein